MDRLKIFAGSSCLDLGRAICKVLGVNLSPIKSYTYRTGCFEVALEENVRGCKAFLIQTLIPDKNLLHLHIWELLQMINAAKKASAREITVVIPYLSYARSDKKWRGRMPIAGKLFAALLEKAGMDRIVGIDFHSPEFEGFFDTETIVDHLRTLPLFVRYLKEKNLAKEEVIVLPGDAGFYNEVKVLAESLDFDYGRVEKERIDADKVIVTGVEGRVKGKIVVLADDEICTGGTAGAILEFLEGADAKEAFIIATHWLGQGKVLEHLSHPLVKEIAVTGTVPLDNPAAPPSIKDKLPLKMLSVAPLLADAIKEIYEEGSVSKLFQ